MRLQLAARGENVLFWPQNLDIWGQKSIFCLVIAIFVDGTNDHYTRGSNFPIGTTPKKFSVSELGVIFWGSPLFLAVFGHWRVRRATTLNFGPISTKLGGIVRAIKKMTQKDNGPGPGRNYGETGVFTFGRKVVFGLKMGHANNWWQERRTPTQQLWLWEPPPSPLIDPGRENQPPTSECLKLGKLSSACQANSPVAGLESNSVNRLYYANCPAKNLTPTKICYFDFTSTLGIPKITIPL